MNKKLYIIGISIMLSLLHFNILYASVVVKEIILQKPYNKDKIEEYDIDNCNGRFPSRTVGASLTTSEALEVGGGQSITAGGSVVVFGVKLSLSSTIKDEVVRQYGYSISHSDSILLKVKAGKHIVFKIRHVRKFVKGHVIVQKTEYFFKKSTKWIPFTYCVSYKLRKEAEREINCPGPYLVIENATINPRSRCRNNFRTYNISVLVKNQCH